MIAGNRSCHAFSSKEDSYGLSVDPKGDQTDLEWITFCKLRDSIDSRARCCIYWTEREEMDRILSDSRKEVSKPQNSDLRSPKIST